jgi:preprotein translocase subunit YajC
MHGILALLTPSGQAGGPPGFVFFIEIALMVAVFYFLLIRPQRKQQDEHKALIAALQKGDQIVTSGGIVGEVIHLKEAEVTIKSGESRLVVLRANIATVLNRAAEAKSA